MSVRSRALSAALALARSAALGPDALLVALPVVLLLAFARGPEDALLALLLPAAALLALAAGLHRFSPPSSVLELIEVVGRDPPGEVITNQHLIVWWPRYVFNLPAIVVAALWSVPFERTFALYTTGLLAIETAILTRAAGVGVAMPRGASFAVGLGLGCVVLLLATRMNGRLVLAHVGMSAILLAQMGAIAGGGLGRRGWSLLAFGLLAGHMTTGAGLVAYGQVVLGTLIPLALFGLQTAGALAGVALLSLVFAPVIVGDISKNVEFYGGGLAALPRMLEHGAGASLARMPWLGPLVLAGAFAIAAVLWRMRGLLAGASPPFVPPTVGVLVAAGGGLFGFSAASLGAPALLAHGGHFAARLSSARARERRGAAWAKRALDLALGVPALLLALPAIAVLGLAVRLTSPGSALYVAERVGRGERLFRQIKLRTMVAGADRAGYRTVSEDPRVTALGRFLRATSLDELPQLWNVLRGEMSLVGPRPAAPAQLAQYAAEQRRLRASVRPGISGLAQVSGRSALSTEDSLALDLRYAEQASVWLDLEILWRTVLVVLARKGTN